MRFSLRASVLFVFSLILLQCEASAQEIGLIAPLTGPLSYMGQESLNGAQLYFETAHTQVKLRVEDSSYQPAKAVTAFQALQNSGIKYFIVVGTPPVLAVRPVSEKSGCLVMASLAAHPNLLDGTALMLRHAGPMDAQARALVPELPTKRPLKIAVISAEADWTQEFVRVLKAELERNKDVALAEYSHLPGETDFRPIVLRVRESRPDVIVANSYGAGAGLLIKQIRELGEDAPIYATSGLVISQDGLDLVKKSGLHGIKYFTVNDPPAAFIELYQKRYGANPRFFAYWLFQDTELMLSLVNANNPAEAAGAVKKKGELKGRYGLIKIDANGDILEPVVLKDIEE